MFYVARGLFNAGKLMRHRLPVKTLHTNVQLMGTHKPSGAVLGRPTVDKIGRAKLFVIVSSMMLIGGKMSESIAYYLAEYVSFNFYNDGPIFMSTQELLK